MCYKHREYSVTEAQEGTEGVGSNPTTLATNFCIQQTKLTNFQTSYGKT